MDAFVKTLDNPITWYKNKGRTESEKKTSVNSLLQSRQPTLSFLVHRYHWSVPDVQNSDNFSFLLDLILL
jgi:hypothetical protein